MFNSLRIKNFRCFQDINLTSLKRINLIAGKNNVGKTALLEAIFLHLGPNNPDLLFKIDFFRGITSFALDIDSIWESIYFGEDKKEEIKLTSIDDQKAQRSVIIRFIESDESQELQSANGNSSSIKMSGSQATTFRQKELIYEYEGRKSQKAISRMWVASDGPKVNMAKIERVPPGIFISTMKRFPEEDAERFSRIERAGQEEKILATMKILEPRLRRMAVLVMGGKPIIAGDIGVGHLVPIPLMGEGMGRLLSIVLAIAHAPKGFVLIDEIENGLHHTVRVDVWRAIADAARRSNTQIFATTHSWECIQAAHQAFKSNKKYNFKMYRLDRIEDNIKAIAYDQKTLEAAIATELELR